MNTDQNDHTMIDLGQQSRVYPETRLGAYIIVYARSNELVRIKLRAGHMDITGNYDSIYCSN